jgi:hypothetical protein
MVKSVADGTMLLYGLEAVLSPVSEFSAPRWPVKLSGSNACSYKVEVKLSLCLTKHYAMKTYKGMDV